MRRIKVDTKFKQAEKVEIKEPWNSRHRRGTAENKRIHRLSALTHSVCVSTGVCESSEEVIDENDDRLTGTGHF